MNIGMISFFSLLFLSIIFFLVYLKSKLTIQKEKVIGEEKKVVKTEKNSKRLPFKPNNAVLVATINAILILSIFPLIGLLCMWIQSHEAIVLKFFNAQ
jgi:hypothetical protein